MAPFSIHLDGLGIGTFCSERPVVVEHGKIIACSHGFFHANMERRLHCDELIQHKSNGVFTVRNPAIRAHMARLRFVEGQQAVHISSVEILLANNSSQASGVCADTIDLLRSILRPRLYFPEKFTVGTCCDAGVPSKYALFLWYPAIPAQMLLGNSPMNVL